MKKDGWLGIDLDSTLAFHKERGPGRRDRRADPALQHVKTEKPE